MAKSPAKRTPATKSKGRRRKSTTPPEQASFDFDRAPAAAARKARWRWLPYALVIAAALLVHSPGLEGPFQFDDLSLPGDPAIGRAGGWLDILTNPTRTRTLTYLTYWLNDRLHGFVAYGFHAVNLALFGVLLTVLAVVYRKVAPPLAAVGALAVFALHPLQTEAVTYIFARATLLAALLSACAWLAWIHGRRWQSAAWFALAMLAKEEAAAMPVFLAGFDVFWRRASLRPAWRPLAAMSGIVALSGARLLYAVSKTPGSGVGEDSAGISAWSYLLTQFRAIWLYLRLLAAPYGQNFDRQWTPSESFDIATALAWASLSALAATGFWFLKRKPEIYWWLGGLLLLLPTSSVMPLADLTAERRMMLPLLSLSLGLGFLLRRLPLKPAVCALLAASIAMGAMTWRRTQVWRSTESLWADAVAKSPDKVRPKLQLARALESKGAASEDERLSLLEKAHGLDPSNPVTVAELGVFHLRRNDPVKALAAFRLALELAPDDPQIRANIGSSLWLLGRRSEAIEAFRKALATDPCNFDARNNLVLAMRALGSAEEFRRLAVTPPDCRFSAAQRAALEKTRQQ